MDEKPTAEQEAADRFYWSHGKPCCAGCDWWHRANSVIGECTRSAPLSQSASRTKSDRLALLGIRNCSLPPSAGHVLTPRDHVCGEFKDTFDWRSLPIGYLKRIGVPAYERR